MNTDKQLNIGKMDPYPSHQTDVNKETPKQR